MGHRVGQQLGHYRLTRLLGQGGFAEVYLAEHLHLGTDAAIKVLHTHLVSPQEIEAFRSEARTIARLKHPHIIRVFDFGLEEGLPYLVMEYASAGTLRQRHPKGSRLELVTIIPYVKQVASALFYAHEHKLIHRDVKPENMLVGEQGELLLSDFGVAIVAQSSRNDHTRDTVGTISYMAPEQIQAHPRPASDQYALGVVIYEWLTGEPPFTGSFPEIAAKHCLIPPPPLREKVPGISPELEQVIFTALAKDPKERFRSVVAFATALEQASSGDRGLTTTMLMAPDRPPLSSVQESIKPAHEIPPRAIGPFKHHLLHIDCRISIQSTSRTLQERERDGKEICTCPIASLTSKRSRRGRCNHAGRQWHCVDRECYEPCSNTPSLHVQRPY
ncbi:hypothetical protein KSF_002180 [Reticulibacter mediterranei]|uniref:non-specific serine/threonine protein kinase n=1 Tax=Reticulibacter mediterranei TaxID=2778369 RepID=A0A8J3ID04_9CHLR|nr:serine/threonine-protein kinase [Reticulibacter mediterranei]GHO90170.1 hypothetical protein KSF_002180 [Reticulibacter mediterranei]